MFLFYLQIIIHIRPTYVHALDPEAFLVILNPRKIYITPWHSKSLFIQHFV